MVMQVAGYLLKQYQEKFKGGTLSVTWNYLRQSMNSYLSQPNPVTARWEGSDHLRDPNFQLDAFRVCISFMHFEKHNSSAYNYFLCSTGHLACFKVLLFDSGSTRKHLEALVLGIDV